LTVGGLQAMEELLPGLVEDLKGFGVPESDPPADIYYASKCGWFPRFDSPLRLLQPTRHFLEWYIRDRVRKLSSVIISDETRVTGLVESAAGRIAGVRTVHERTGYSEIVHAELVVDTGGRGSRAPKWLADLGYAPPSETVVDAHWGYATTYVQTPKNWEPGYQALYVGPTVSGPGSSATRGGAMWQQEDDQWVMTAQGCAGDYPSADLATFRTFMGSFGVPDFNKLLNRAEVVGPLEVWRNTANRLRDYANIAEMPENFLVLGDAAVSFNPIYAQGMAASAFGARLLRALLSDSGGDGGLESVAQTFQNQLDLTVIQPCWRFSTGSDYLVPGAERNGEQLVVDDPINSEAAYFERVLALASEDKDVTLKVWETILLTRGAEWLGDQRLRARISSDWDRLGGVSRV
jgi:hypothetical protein